MPNLWGAPADWHLVARLVLVDASLANVLAQPKVGDLARDAVVVLVEQHVARSQITTSCDGKKERKKRMSE